MTTHPEPAALHAKRSQSVTLVLLAGAGATALGLTQIDRSQREEDVLVYPDLDACIVSSLRTEGDCRRDYALARAAYPEGAPRYDTLAQCESHHGPLHCVAGGLVAESARGRFVPVMAAFLVGRWPEQDLAPQPVYDHRPREASGGAGHGGGYGGGYCTGWGGRVVTGGGGTASSGRVASSAVRRAGFGGFGATGRGFSSSHGSGG
jgi:uncharacterized protein YgiB involved in biofilm formation